MLLLTRTQHQHTAELLDFARGKTTNRTGGVELGVSVKHRRANVRAQRAGGHMDNHGALRVARESNLGVGAVLQCPLSELGHD